MRSIKPLICQACGPPFDFKRPRAYGVGNGWLRARKIVWWIFSYWFRPVTWKGKMSFFRLKIYVNLSLKGMQIKVEVLPLIYYTYFQQSSSSLCSLVALWANWPAVCGWGTSVSFHPTGSYLPVTWRLYCTSFSLFRNQRTQQRKRRCDLSVLTVSKRSGMFTRDQEMVEGKTSSCYWSRME